MATLDIPCCHLNIIQGHEVCNMWWKMVSKSDKTSDGQAVIAAYDGPFEFERTIRELRERKGDLRPADAALFPEPLRSTLNFAIRIGKISLTDFAKRTELDVSQARCLAELLIAKKLFRFSPFSHKMETFYEAGLSTTTCPLPRVGLRLEKS